VLYKRDGNPLERPVDVAPRTCVRFLRVSLEERATPFPLGHRALKVPATRKFAARLTSLEQIGTIT